MDNDPERSKIYNHVSRKSDKDEPLRISCTSVISKNTGEPIKRAKLVTQDQQAEIENAAKE